MLAIRIMQLRKHNGMSQLQLAQILHISASAEGMYEQGRRVPSLETLTAMAALFHVSLDYLITGADYVGTSAPNKYDAPGPSPCCRCCSCIGSHPASHPPCAKK